MSGGLNHLVYDDISSFLRRFETQYGSHPRLDQEIRNELVEHGPEWLRVLLATAGPLDDPEQPVALEETPSGLVHIQRRMDGKYRVLWERPEPPSVALVSRIEEALRMKVRIAEVNEGQRTMLVERAL